LSRCDGFNNESRSPAKELIMLELASEFSVAQEDGGLPITLSAGSAAGESGVCVLSAYFKDGMHIAATRRSRHHICFQISDHSRFDCRIADQTLRHEPRTGMMAICPAESDYVAHSDQSVEAILVAIDPGQLTLAAAEDSALDVQLIDRLSSYDQALFDLARGLALESASGYPNGPLFWNETASALIDSLLARHTTEFDGRTKGTLGKDVFRRLRDYIVEHLDEPIEVAALASIAGRSPFHFTRVFAQAVGVSPHRYVVHLRLERAVELMRDRQSGLADIAACTGFADQSHLSRWVRRVYGVSPTELAA
jgi:AraC family transcriptional regulator